MNGYNFTDRVRKVLQMAREEAARLNHEYVGTEHLLLGLIRDGEGVGAAVLTNLNIDLLEVRQRIEGITKKEKTTTAVGPDLPYTSRAKKVLELSMSEARELHHPYVGTEHLLLGLLREGMGIAGQVLTDAGASLALVRAETLRLLGTDEFSPPSRGKPPSRERIAVPYNLTLEPLRLVGGIVFVLSGVEAFWYAPGFLKKALGLLGAVGGLLMIAFWLSSDRKRGSGSG